MSKSITSYFDWELSHRKKSHEFKNSSDQKKEKEINSLGIPQDTFKNYLERWKKENL
ncbi:MAG: hypothetical protein BAJALOKI2v1_180032 [Promethearchaeota archaeon]|nr:MAG: hypothetical protein BAJALOKI2v1_180032 [Candidatus Lokiarchaeota archaeon]